MDEPRRAKLAAPLLRLLILRIAMPADVSAHGPDSKRTPAPTTPTVSPTRQSTRESFVIMEWPTSVKKATNGADVA
jgi:hypothetical protein